MVFNVGAVKAIKNVEPFRENVQKNQIRISKNSGKVQYIFQLSVRWNKNITVKTILGSESKTYTAHKAYIIDVGYNFKRSKTRYKNTAMFGGVFPIDFSLILTFFKSVNRSILIFTISFVYTFARGHDNSVIRAIRQNVARLWREWIVTQKTSGKNYGCLADSCIKRKTTRNGNTVWRPPCLNVVVSQCSSVAAC